MPTVVSKRANAERPNGDNNAGRVEGTEKLHQKGVTRSVIEQLQCCQCDWVAAMNVAMGTYAVCSWRPRIC